MLCTSVSPGEQKPKLLIYGRNRTLLELRSTILARKGYDVSPIHDAREIISCLKSDDMFSLLILCHTIPPKDREEARLMALPYKLPIYQISPMEPPLVFEDGVAEMVPTTALKTTHP
jgi:hypothetical protein